MTPIPPSQREQSLLNLWREAPPEGFCGDARGDGVIGHASRDHGARYHNSTGADANSRQDDGAVTDPYVVANGDRLRTPQSEKIFLVLLHFRPIG
jgi:hypothetical protein